MADANGRTLSDAAAQDGSYAGSDTRALDELAGRLAKLEAAVANPRPAQLDPAVANRVSAIEGEIKRFKAAVAGKKLRLWIPRSRSSISHGSQARPMVM